MSGLCHTIESGKRYRQSTGGQRTTVKVHNGIARLQPYPCLPRQSSLKLAVAASGHVSADAAISGPQAILDRYRAMLHEYHAHKASLGDWITAVRSQHQRQPQLLDAEATGDAALVSRFQQYLMVRKRLLAEIPLLREQLVEALDHQQQPHHQAASSSNHQQHKRHSSSSSSSGQSSYGVVNANRASLVSKPQAIGQFFAAVNYRKQHAVRGDSVSSNAEQQPLPAASGADQPMPARSSSEQLQTGAAAIPAAASSTNSSGSTALAGTQASPARAAVAAAKAGAVSHLLNSATNSSSTNPSSSRAAAAALAALSYKKQKQGGPAADTIGGSSMHQQRPLAIQMAASPPPPAGYAADGTRLADGGSAAGPAVVLGTVETATGDAYAGRQRRQLDRDTSLDATLQGVPGGLGGAAYGPIFATAKAVQADAVSATAVSNAANISNSSTAPATAEVPANDAVLAAAARAAAAANAPVGQVVTAKFDVYSGRQRKLDPEAQLDDYFASIEHGYSSQLAAAVNATNSSSGGPSAGSSKGAETSVQKAAGEKAMAAQRRSSFGSSVPHDSGLLDMGMPDIVPLPT